MKRPPSTLAALERRAARDTREHARDMAASGGNLAAWRLMVCMEAGERLSVEAATVARDALMSGATATPRGVHMHPEAVRAFVGQLLAYLDDRRRGCGASAFEGVSAAAATLAKRPAPVAHLRPIPGGRADE
jgi:hypothetical protein